MTRYGTASSAPFNGNHYDSNPAEQFGMSAFSVVHGRRRKRGNSLARWTTKAVLLSPLVILSVWSLIVVFSGTKKLNHTQSSQGIRLPNRSLSKQSVRLPFRPPKKGAASPQLGSSQQLYANPQQGMIVQPANLGNYLPPNRKVVDTRMRPHPRRDGLASNGKMIPVYAPLGNAEDSQQLQGADSSPLEGDIDLHAPLGDTPDGQREAQLLQRGTLQMNGKMIPIYPRRDSHPGEGGGRPFDGKLIPIYAPLPLGDTQEVQQQYVMKDAQETQQSIAFMNSDSITSNNQLQQVSGENEQDATLMMSMPLENEIMNADITQSLQAHDTPMMELPNPLGSTHTNVIVRPRPKPRAKSVSTTKILYYDPSTVFVNGQLYIPELVYDANGNQINLTSLQAESGAEVYLEPPGMQEVAPSQLRLEAGQQSPLVQSTEPIMQMSRQDLQKLAAQPPAQDQYIIIATVAVMALLVGALSARRMRSRTFLSSCIENESLEDEIAYDVATTNGDYSTFAGNWKGADLEKFDV